MKTSIRKKSSLCVFVERAWMVTYVSMGWVGGSHL